MKKIQVIAVSMAISVFTITASAYNGTVMFDVIPADQLINFSAPRASSKTADELLQRWEPAIAYSYNHATPPERLRAQKTQVPEPATLLLLGSGLCILAFWGKRRKDTPRS